MHDDEENDKRIMKRVKANDPAALSAMGGKHHDEGNHVDSFECYTKAAEFGDVDAHHRLGFMYDKGDGVEKGEEKSVYHYEKAAIGGHPIARTMLALKEERNGNIERAVKHHIIAANLGHDLSMKALWGHYSAGNITKEDLDATLRAHQAAIVETKSEQRDVAERYFRR
jgi:TPR repeat protein